MAELFGDDDSAPASENGNGNGKANGNGAKAKPVAKTTKPALAAVAASGEETLTDPFGNEPEMNGADISTVGASESSSEPAGAAPLMAAPTSPAALAAPQLPERIADAVSGKAQEPGMFAGEGVRFDRIFTRPGEDVYATTEWDKRSAAITDGQGGVVFEQKDCEIPASWSQLATKVVVSKYFRGKVGTPQRENSVRQLISRVADTIYHWGKKDGYFASDADADTFHDELRYLLLHQYMAFNSPVWFNLGVQGERPQVSACFINSVDDTMDSILTLAKTEGMLFKWGSGTGTNLSVLRSSEEGLKGGGTASGPVSFMRGFDAFAGAIKSGGKTRRAAKMVILNADHPDVEEFIECKADAEKKAHALIEAGYSGAFNVPNGAYDSVFFQNANHSVRATDDFMRAVELDRDWTTVNVLDGAPAKTFRARDLMHKIAEAAWVCGDPGMQYDTTANRWHTVPNTGRINASNPCCITGDTLIAVADGRNAVPIRDLVGTVPDVYAWDHQAKRTTIAPMYGIEVKRQNAPVFRVTLDDGSSFRATDDHLIMLRDGSYRQVKDLETGDSLNPFHSEVRRVNDSRTPRRYIYTGRGWRAQYRWLWEMAYGAAPTGYHIHHSDFNSLNDALSNLVLLLASEHEALHRDQMLGDRNPARRLMNDTWRAHISEATRGENNPRWNNPHTPEARAKMQESARALWDQPEQRAHASDAANKRVSDARAEGKPIGRPVSTPRFERCCPACRENFVSAREAQIFCSNECRFSPLGLAMIGKKGGETRRGMSPSPEHCEKLRASSIAASRPEDKRRAAEEGLRARCLKAARLLLDAGYDLRLDNWENLRSEARRLGAPHAPQAATLRRLFEDEADLQEAAALYNHKVVSVVFDGVENVYDGTVDGHHNFAIVTSATAGIGGPDAPNFSGCFIHNSEFFFLDDTACNLASLNLMKFRRDDREMDLDAFRHAVRVTATAMEIMVGNAAYPTDKITINSFDYRPLGLGYANLGALLMARGLPYDSDEGRAFAAAITAVLSGEGYAQSARIAGRVGTFAGYEKNRQPMLRVMQMHRDHVEAIGRDYVPAELIEAARSSWDTAIEIGQQNGYRNAQISVLAPTGCLVAGSLVLTDRGLSRLSRLGDVNGEQWQDVQFNVLTDDGEKRATKFYVNGPELTRRIVTRSGYAIQGTLKHQIKVVDAETGAFVWKRMSDIAPGDTVALSMGTLIGAPKTVQLPPLGEEYWTGDYQTRAPRTMTPDLAELIGYFMGDGSLHAKGPRFCVANTDADVADRVRALVKSLFNLDAFVTPQQGYHEVAVHSVPLALWWEACGFAKRSPSAEHSGKGYVPHVPDAVLATNDPATYGAFVRGLYEADGTVTNGIPCWTTTQSGFSDEVKTLLLALGVPTTTRQTITGWGQSPAYVLRLRNTSYATRFAEAVGFMSARKAALVTHSAGEQTARHDYVYLGHAVVDELIPALHPLRNAALLAMRRHDGAITRRTARALLAETGDARVEKALGFFYDRIETNQDGGEQETFDLSVPENVTYIAQGFISHNTIGFMMDCDTTGVEPDIAIVKFKSLVGGGMFKIVNQTVPEALERLGYSASERKAILDYIEANDTIEGAPGLSDAHLPVFDCAFRAMNGVRTINYMGHIRMMAAVQPFLSGAISKTVNMPHDATPEDITEAYMQAWKLGVKSLAIYRDGSKKTQPLSTGSGEKKEEVIEAVAEAPAQVAAQLVAQEPRPFRRKLPDERQSLTHKFSVGGHEGYITVGLYPDQTPGEIFITMSKEGSVVSGLMDSFATAISLALQYGVPLRTLVEKFMHTRFEPSGFTGNPEIPMAKSIMDYLFRYMALKFLNRDERSYVGLLADQQDDYDTGGSGAATSDALNSARATASAPQASPTTATPSQSATGSPGTGATATAAQGRATGANSAESQVFVTQADAPPCPTCGTITLRNGACYRCPNCGTSIGCS